jgi:hypothetical protein
LEDEAAAKFASSPLPAEETPNSPRRERKKSARTLRSAPDAPFVATPDATRRLFRELVERYYRARFSGSPPTADEKARWAAALREAKIG